ncbi:MAG: tetratricopeptide repeat protein [Acidobacteriia bacterium]|nr:tetratricopeptide repeat protein [Terriglobia bacterium]
MPSRDLGEIQEKRNGAIHAPRRRLRDATRIYRARYELPLAWYAKGGGSAQLFPGKIPDGVDCQRFHGPGRNHIEAVRGGDKKKIQEAIVNLARLPGVASTRCGYAMSFGNHELTTASVILRVDRGVFSYRPGEPDPAMAEAFASLGDMLALQGKTARAIPFYRRALALRPDLESARTGLRVAGASPQ